MTELAQRAANDESPSAAGQLDDESSDVDGREPDRDRSIAGRSAQKGLVWVVGAGLTVLVVAWVVLLSPGETGSRADWFFGVAVFGLSLVTVWQTHVIARGAAREAADAAERSRADLAAAEVRAARQVALLRSLHETEREAQRELAHAQMEAYRNLSRAELEAQQRLARAQSSHLLAHQQRLAVTEVSRAVSTHTHVLGKLWNDGARILRLTDRQERERAMQPVFDEIALAVKDFSVELANAQLLVSDDRLQRALLRVNEAVVAAMRVAEDLHVAVVEGDASQNDPVAAAQRLLHERAAEARHLAWQLLRTSLDDPAEAPS